MNIFGGKQLSIFLALSICAISPAHAVIIDFEGVIPAGETRTGDPIFPYTEDGFLLSDVDSGNMNALFGPSGFQNDNGTDVLGWISGSAFSISAVDGSLFSLLSFDATNLDPGGAAGTFDLVGTFADNSTISASFTNILNTFSTFSLGGAWSGLASVDIRNLGMRSGAIDNIDVVPVPEPGTLGLLVAGLLGLGFIRRKRQQG